MKVVNSGALNYLKIFMTNEMLAIMHALAKFRQYLVGARFVVKSDHNNLKYLLDKKDLNER
jgi:hypothetical protein